MNGKIIQKGTGYCVGAIIDNDIFIDLSLVGDELLRASIVWDKPNIRVDISEEKVCGHCGKPLINGWHQPECEEAGHTWITNFKVVKDE